ncbi:hypothetical protein TNCV_3264821 [Trichonephila clavipes]|nr:hypothetical protein TNCV_3264821 [Trichonephila clavipes]
MFYDYLEPEDNKGKEAFIQAVWIVICMPRLHNLLTRAWTGHGLQTLAPWIKFCQIVLNGFYGPKWLNSVFEVPYSCSIYLSLIHWPKRTQCVVMYFIQGVCYNTWTFTPPVPSEEHHCETHKNYVARQKNGRMITGKEHNSGPLKAPTHFMILIPSKMNFPDYDGFIDIFSVPMPISSLPPTPVASPSHEPSQDSIYD